MVEEHRLRSVALGIAENQGKEKQRMRANSIGVALGLPELKILMAEGAKAVEQA